MGGLEITLYPPPALPMAREEKKKTVLPLDTCKSTRVSKSPSSHTPRVIKKCDFGKKKKGKEMKRVRLVLLFIYFFMAKGDDTKAR